MKYFLILSLSFLIFSCKKETNNPNPTPSESIILSNVELDSFTDSTATFSVTIQSGGNSGISSTGLCYSKTQSPTLSNSVVTSTVTNSVFTCTISYLEKDSLYYIRAYAQNTQGVFYSVQVSYIAGSQTFEGAYQSFIVDETLLEVDNSFQYLFLDLDNDDDDETGFRIWNNQDVTGWFVAPYNNTYVSIGRGDVYASDIQFAMEYDESDSTILCQALSLNDDIDDSLTFIPNDYPHLAIHQLLPEEKKWGSFHGEGDKYIGFKIEREEDKYYYGWIKVNLSTDMKTLVVLDGAISNQEGAPIKAGEK